MIWTCGPSCGHTNFKWIRQILLQLLIGLYHSYGKCERLVLQAILYPGHFETYKTLFRVSARPQTYLASFFLCLAQTRVNNWFFCLLVLKCDFRRNAMKKTVAYIPFSHALDFEMIFLKG